MTAWFKQDDTFNTPKAAIKIRTLVPSVSQDVTSAAMAHLYGALVNDALNEFSYPASLAGLYFSVSATSRGFDLMLSGYNDRQGLLLNRILSVMQRARFDQSRFERLKQELIRNWKNQPALTPYEQLFRKAPALLYQPYWDELEMAAALQTVSWKALRRFGDALWEGSQLQVLMYGNLYKQEALQLTTLIEHHLHKDADDETPTLSPAEVVRLSTAPSHYFLPTNHQDVAVVLYQQALSDTLIDRANMLMLRQLQKSAFFHQLRTQQQLGYIVFASSMGLKNVADIVWVVQSPSASLGRVVEAIDTFIRQPIEGFSDFESHRQALLSDLTEAPKSLNEQASRYWSEILRNATMFDDRAQLIEAVKSLQPDQVKAYADNLIESQQRLWMLAGEAADSVSEGVVGDEVKTTQSKLGDGFYVYP